jgi:putative glutamine amidotransferase
MIQPRSHDAVAARRRAFGGPWIRPQANWIVRYFSRARPVVGVTSSRNGGRLMWWFNWLALWRAGARGRRLLPGKDLDIDKLAALIIGGGDDIDAALYGGEFNPTVRLDPERDAFEIDLIERALPVGMPILGICRGAQILNVVLGGTLHEHIYDVYVDAPRIRTPLPRKTIHIRAGTRLHALIRRTRDRVNALHHQSIAKLGKTLRVVAQDEHGIVQAIESTDARFLLGVQWHPEFMVFDRRQVRLFGALVQAGRAVNAE